MQRLALSDWAQRHNIVIPQVVAGDSITYLNSLNAADSGDKPERNKPECIYVDPMFPEKRKSSALAKKNMQVLHNIVGADADQETLFVKAYQASQKRVVVKRPLYAESLGSSIDLKPTEQIKGKLLYYDIYLK